MDQENFKKPRARWHCPKDVPEKSGRVRFRHEQQRSWPHRRAARENETSRDHAVLSRIFTCAFCLRFAQSACLLDQGYMNACLRERPDHPALSQGLPPPCADHPMDWNAPLAPSGEASTTVRAHAGAKTWWENGRGPVPKFSAVEISERSLCLLDRELKRTTSPRRLRALNCKPVFSPLHYKRNQGAKGQGRAGFALIGDRVRLDAKLVKLMNVLEAGTAKII